MARFESKLNKAYGLTRWGVTCRELFVVKYEAGMQTSLAPHRDGTISTLLSANIALNLGCGEHPTLQPPCAFLGGGTQLSQFDDVVVSAPTGAAVTHPSKMLHGGAKIESGVRFLLVGFFDVASPVTYVDSWLVAFGDYLIEHHSEIVFQIRDILHL